MVLPDFPKQPEGKRKRQYETDVNQWVIQRAERENFGQLSKQLQDLLDEAADLDRSFDAFFALANLNRLYHKVDTLESLIQKHGQRFRAYEPLITHLEIMCLNLREERESCLKALKLATKIRTDWKGQHAGLSHSYAETVAICVDRGYRSTGVEALLKEGLEAAEEAIKEEEYAKFYRTRGWLQFLLKDVEEARSSYRAAIELENPERRDYVIRVGDYRRQLDLLNARLDLDQLKGELAGLRSEANALQTRQLEFLGFFTGILALILGGGGLLVTAQNDVARFVLMLTLGGLLMLVFGSFNFMLHGKIKLERSLLPMVVGFLLLLASGLWLFWQS